MDLLAAVPPLNFLADATAAANDMRSFVMPFFKTFVVIAGLTCATFLAVGGYYYMTSSGRPDRLDQAKKIIRNALIGLVVVIAATTITALLSHSYSQPHNSPTQGLPALTEIKPEDKGFDPADLILKGINNLLLNGVQSIGSSVIGALGYFTSSTPLMAETQSVFNLWLVMVAIADVLFILVVAMLGFHIMSADALGFDEIEIKHLLPQIALVFLLLNSSIFVIDAIVSLSNAMIHAFQAGVDSKSVWETLTSVVKDQAGGLGIAALFIMVAFLVLAVMLLIYYIMRMVVLFLGAVLSPIVILLWLLPSFRDFANTLIRAYLVTVFVLFVHTVILVLAATLFSGVQMVGDNKPDPLMSVILGIATLVLLLKSQGVINQMAFVGAGAKASRKLGSQFVTGMSHVSNKVGEAANQYASSQIAQARAQYALNALATRGSKK